MGSSSRPSNASPRRSAGRHRLQVCVLKPAALARVARSVLMLHRCLCPAASSSFHNSAVTDSPGRLRQLVASLSRRNLTSGRPPSGGEILQGGLRADPICVLSCLLHDGCRGEHQPGPDASPLAGDKAPGRLDGPRSRSGASLHLAHLPCSCCCCPSACMPASDPSTPGGRSLVLFRSTPGIPLPRGIGTRMWDFGPTGASSFASLPPNCRSRCAADAAAVRAATPHRKLVRRRGQDQERTQVGLRHMRTRLGRPTRPGPQRSKGASAVGRSAAAVPVPRLGPGAASHRICAPASQGAKRDPGLGKQERDFYEKQMQACVAVPAPQPPVVPPPMPLVLLSPPPLLPCRV